MQLNNFLKALPFFYLYEFFEKKEKTFRVNGMSSRKVCDLQMDVFQPTAIKKGVRILSALRTDRYAITWVISCDIASKWKRQSLAGMLAARLISSMDRELSCSTSTMKKLWNYAHNIHNPPILIFVLLV